MTRAMKNSGIEWIGEIPENWKIGRIKNILNILTDYTANGSFADLAKNVEYLDYESYARLVRLTDLRSNLQNYDSVYVNEDSYNYLDKSKLYGGEILLANVGAYAGLFCEMPQYNKPATLGPNMFLITTNAKMLQHYLFYLGNSAIIYKQLSAKMASAAQPKLNKQDIKNTYLLIPPLSEQQAIADFLDGKCAEIDNLTTAITEQIEVLKQYKKSVITKAVTKGLDPTAPMKDSGVEWIGMIPENWEVGKIKYYFNIINGATPSSSNEDYWDGEIRWITPADMPNEGFIEKGKRNISQNGYTSCGTTIVPKGSIIISSRAPIGKINLSTKELCTNQGCKSLVRNTDNRFSYYYLISHKNILELLGRGTTFIELSTFDLENFIYLDPPLPEQLTIADYLDDKCAQINSVIKDKETQLETLASYKKSLIYEYVTGKKEVPQLKEV